jgi:drug/metabolite transporter (DMT)-like permease
MPILDKRILNDESMLKANRSNSMVTKYEEQECKENLNAESNDEKLEKIIKCEEDEEEEENAILELEQVSSLVSSKHSLSKFGKHQYKKSHELIPPDELAELELAETDTASIKKKLLNRFYGIRGCILAFASTLITPISMILVKKAHLFNGFEQAFIRYLIQLILMIGIAKFKKLNMFGPKKQRKLLTLRALIGVAGLLCAYFSLSLIMPSDAGALAQSNVVLTALVARFVLDEKLTMAHILAIVLTLSGAMFICQPTFLFSNDGPTVNTNFTRALNISNSTSNQQIAMANRNSERESFLYSIGLLIAFFDAVCMCLAQILIRKLCIRKVHFVTINIYTSYIGLPFCGIASIIFYFFGITNRNELTEFNLLKWHLLIVCLVALLGTLNQVILNLSLKYEDASKVAVIRTTDLFFSFLFQYLILNITSELLNIIGALLILSSTLLILVYKFLDERNQDKQRQSQEPSIFKRFVFFKF